MRRVLVMSRSRPCSIRGPVARVTAVRGIALAVLVASTICAASCGAGRGAGGAVDAGVDDRSNDRVDPRLALCARYQVVQQVFDDNCVGCHTAGAALDLSDGVSFAHIVNHAAPVAESCGGFLIAPGDPGSSYLYQKLTAVHPCAGMQMPLDELFESQPLPDCMTSIVRDWIQAGAQPPPADGGPQAD